MQQRELNFSRPVHLRKLIVESNIRSLSNQIIAKGIARTAWFKSSRFTVNLEQSETRNAGTRLGRRHKGISNKLTFYGTL